MRKKLCIFLNKNNIISNLQFGFRQHYSTSHASISVTENIRKALDKGNIDCGVFINLQKAFDTVDHQILLAKMVFLKFQLTGLNHICLIAINFYP